MADKREFHYFLLPEYEQEEQYLNDMAKKGYIFEKVTNPGIYSFNIGVPQNIIYRIDFNPQRRSDRDSYLQMFEDYGWKYLQDMNEFSYFCKVDDGSDDEILSDNQSRIEMLERIFRRKMIPILVIFLCCVVPQVFRVPLVASVSNIAAIILYGIFVVLAFLYIYIISRCTIGFRRLKNKYEL